MVISSVIMAASVDKKLLGLLNGIAKREYYGESEITDEFLHEELYSGMEKTVFDTLLNRFQNLVKTMTNSDMDFRQLEAFFTSQKKRRDGCIVRGAGKSSILYIYLLEVILGVSIQLGRLLQLNAKRGKVGVKQLRVWFEPVILHTVNER